LWCARPGLTSRHHPCPLCWPPATSVDEGVDISASPLPFGVGRRRRALIKDMLRIMTRMAFQWHHHHWLNLLMFFSSFMSIFSRAITNHHAIKMCIHLPKCTLQMLMPVNGICKCKLNHKKEAGREIGIWASAASRGCSSLSPAAELYSVGSTVQ
jgi:hypothetical protein